MIPSAGADASVTGVDMVLSGWINVSRVTITLSNDTPIERHVEDHGPGVAVLPYDIERRTALLVSQPRAAVLLAGERPVLEAIAGRLDGMDPASRIYAEAMEEAGVALATLEPVAHLWTMPSISTERLHLFLAPYTVTDRIGAGGGCRDEGENITVHEVALVELAQHANAGQLPDAKTLILVQALRLRQPGLFA